MTGPSKYRKAISCIGLRSTALPLFEERLPADERSRLENHIPACASCSEESSDVQKLRRTMKRMPVHKAPADLGVRLRVLGSRESHRRRVRGSFPAMCKAWLQDSRLWMNNLMRPLAIPTAGGFVSAVLLFGALAPSLAVPVVSAQASPDVPTVFYVEPTVKSHIPIGFEAEEELTVEISLDEEGRVVDYSLPHGADKSSMRQRRGIENQILFTQFTPATRLGQGMSSKVRVTFRSTRVTVKG